MKDQTAMWRFFLFLSLILSSTPANARSEQDITLTYKAYWGGFVISEIYSRAQLSDEEYRVEVAYDVTGLASIFSNMKSKSSVHGIILPDGQLKPLQFDNAGSWSKSHFTTTTHFDRDSSQITAHDFDFKFKKEAKYIPIDEGRRRGPDMMSYYLGLILDPMALRIADAVMDQNVFGGFFLLNMAYKCPEMKEMDSRRAVYHGPVIACEFNDKIVDGKFIATEKAKKKKKRKKKKKEKKPQPVQLWFAQMDDIGARIPVYAEFAIGWGKVRVYLAGMEVSSRPQKKDAP